MVGTQDADKNSILLATALIPSHESKESYKAVFAALDKGIRRLGGFSESEGGR